MLQLPRGLWKWLAENGTDLTRIAKAAEKIAEELGRIRAAMEDDQKEENR